MYLAARIISSAVSNCEAVSPPALIGPSIFAISLANVESLFVTQRVYLNLDTHTPCPVPVRLIPLLTLWYTDALSQHERCRGRRRQRTCHNLAITHEADILRGLHRLRLVSSLWLSCKVAHPASCMLSACQKRLLFPNMPDVIKKGPAMSASTAIWLTHHHHRA
jgi:hypothetical protein